ncbi:uncharacterized protein LOC105661840 isoform X3 [Megachile rotundata]|nr:PREDICTED: uncharacterized protein LOC105661840 isoform X4 [Megachile rotundata]
MQRKSGQTIHSEARNIIRHVIRKCDEEARKRQFLYPLQQATIRASEYTGVSVTTITRIRKEDTKYGENESLPSPGKKRAKSEDKKFHCSLENETIIRNIIYEFYVVKKISPTGRTLLKAIQEKIDFPWGLTTLYRLLKRMGFTWKKTHSIKKVLVENPNIVSLRSKYLEAILYCRNDDKNIIYIGKTSVDNTLYFRECWEGQENKKPVKNVSSPHRFNIVHAAGMNGFIRGAELVFESFTTGNYSGQMHTTNFEKWLIEKLLPNISQKSVIIMDDVPWFVQLSKPPSKYSTNKEMIQWLADNNISHGSDMRKYQLYELIERNKKLEKSFKIDETLRLHGHSILRIPPNMSFLNPMEQAWMQQ